MILYFSGTGNSRLAAYTLSMYLNDETEDAFPYIRKKETEKRFSSVKSWVFVCPTYAWQIPRVFEEFILNNHFEGSHRAYFIMTCGSDIGGAAIYLEKLCKKKGLTFCGVKEIIMPENYTAMFPVPKQEEVDEIILAAHEELAAAADSIWRNKRFNDYVNSLDKLKSGPVNKLFYSLFIKPDGFHATERCNRCGKCAKRCPLKGIEIKENGPIWNGSCTHCMACINSCPQKAIEYKNKSQGKPRLYNGKAR